MNTSLPLPKGQYADAKNDLLHGIWDQLSYINGTNPGAMLNRTVKGGLATSTEDILAQILGEIGKMSLPLRNRLNSVVNVKDFLAIGDGVTDDTVAIQAAIDYARALSSVYRLIVVFFPCGEYFITSALNCTNTPGLTIRGAGGRINNTCIIGNTGDLIIDFSGSSNAFLSDIQLKAPNGLSNPSTQGVQFALSKDSANQATPGPQKGGLNGSLHNVSILMGSFVGANNGLGSIALINCRSEEFSLMNVQLQANTPCIFTTTSALNLLTGYNFTVVSKYVPIQDDAIGSMGVVNWSGQNSLHVFEHLTPALLLNGVNSFVFQGYIGRISNETGGTYETAIRCVNYTAGLKILATIESFSQIISVQNTLEGAGLDVTSANHSNSIVPLISLDQYAKILGSNVSVNLPNAAERANRYFLYTAPIDSGNSPTNAQLSNSTFVCSTFPSNPFFVSSNLLKNSTNCEFKTTQPFKKSGPFVTDTKNYIKGLGLVQAGNTPVTASLIRFNKADRTTTNASNAGYYTARVKGVILLGNYTTSNGPCSAHFEGVVTYAQRADGVNLPPSGNVTILTKMTFNGAYLDISSLALGITFAGNQGSVNITVNTAGSGVNEGISFYGEVSLISDFAVNQSALFD